MSQAIVEQWLKIMYPQKVCAPDLIKFTGIGMTSVYNTLRSMEAKKEIYFEYRLKGKAPTKFYQLSETVDKTNNKYHLLLQKEANKEDVAVFFETEKQMSLLISLLESTRKYYFGCLVCKSFETYPRKKIILELLEKIQGEIKQWKQ